MGEKSSVWRRLAAGYVAWSPWIAGYLLAFLGLFFAGAYISNLGEFLTSPATTGWAAAIATFCAAFVALKVAVDDRRRIDSDHLMDAALEMAAAVGEIVLADAYSKAAERFLSGREAAPIYDEAAKNLDKAIKHLNNIPFRIAYRHNPRFGALLAAASDFSKAAEMALRLKDERVLASTQKMLSRLIHATDELLAIGKPIRKQYRNVHLTAEDKAAFD